MAKSAQQGARCCKMHYNRHEILREAATLSRMTRYSASGDSLDPFQYTVGYSALECDGERVAHQPQASDQIPACRSSKRLSLALRPPQTNTRSRRERHERPPLKFKNSNTPELSFASSDTALSNNPWRVLPQPQLMATNLQYAHHRLSRNPHGPCISWGIPTTSG